MSILIAIVYYNPMSRTYPVWTKVICWSCWFHETYAHGNNGQSYYYLWKGKSLWPSLNIDFYLSFILKLGTSHHIYYPILLTLVLLIKLTVISVYMNDVAGILESQRFLRGDSLWWRGSNCVRLYLQSHMYHLWCHNTQWLPSSCWLYGRGPSCWVGKTTCNVIFFYQIFFCQVLMFSNFTELGKATCLVIIFWFQKIFLCALFQNCANIFFTGV